MNRGLFCVPSGCHADAPLKNVVVTKPLALASYLSMPDSAPFKHTCASACLALVAEELLPKEAMVRRRLRRLRYLHCRLVGFVG